MFNLFRRKNKTKIISALREKHLDSIKANMDILISENTRIENKLDDDYLSLYADDNLINFYYQIFKSNVVDKTPNYKNSVGLDLGCRYGISTMFYSEFCNKKIYFSDFYDEDEIIFSRFKDSGLIIKSPLVYVKNDSSNSGIANNIKDDLDWIVLYDVLCNTNYSGITNLINVCLSLLKEGGFLFITDFSYGDENDYKRLEEKFLQNEIGDGDRNTPNGVWFKARMRYIASKYPSLTEDMVWANAYATVGCNFAEIDEHILSGKTKSAPTYDNPAIFVDPADDNKTHINDSLNTLLNTDIILKMLENAGIKQEKIEMRSEERTTCRFYMHIYK